MVSDKVLRMALLASVPFNFLAAFSVAFPDSLTGQLMGLPEAVHPVYGFILAYLIALFGVVYGWLGVQESIYRPLVAFSAMGKAGVFFIMLALAVMGKASVMTAVFTIGDLLFAAIFTAWVLNPARS